MINVYVNPSAPIGDVFANALDRASKELKLQAASGLSGSQSQLEMNNNLKPIIRFASSAVASLYEDSRDRISKKYLENYREIAIIILNRNLPFNIDQTAALDHFKRVLTDIKARQNADIEGLIYQYQEHFCQQDVSDITRNIVETGYSILSASFIFFNNKQSDISRILRESINGVVMGWCFPDVVSASLGGALARTLVAAKFHPNEAQTILSNIVNFKTKQ